MRWAALSPEERAEFDRLAASGSGIRKAHRREERETQTFHVAASALAPLPCAHDEAEGALVPHVPPEEARAAPAPSGVRLLATSDTLPSDMACSHEGLLSAASTQSKGGATKFPMTEAMVGEYLRQPGKSVEQSVADWHSRATQSLPREEMPPGSRLPARVAYRRVCSPWSCDSDAHVEHSFPMWSMERQLQAALFRVLRAANGDQARQMHLKAKEQSMLFSFKVYCGDEYMGTCIALLTDGSGQYGIEQAML